MGIAALHGIAATFAGHEAAVRPDVKGQRERDGAEIERVGAFRGQLDQRVMAPAVAEDVAVIALAADQYVVTRATSQGVVASPARQDVFSHTAHELVVTLAAGQDRAGGGGVDHIVIRAPDHVAKVRDAVAPTRPIGRRGTARHRPDNVQRRQIDPQCPTVGRTEQKRVGVGARIVQRIEAATAIDRADQLGAFLECHGIAAGAQHEVFNPLHLEQIGGLAGDLDDDLPALLDPD